GRRSIAFCVRRWTSLSSGIFTSRGQADTMEVRSVEAIFSALNAADVKYLVVGGLAVNAYGYERLTRDVDLVIGLEPENIIRGLRALLGLGYRMSIPVTPEQFGDPGDREAWRKEKKSTVLRRWSDSGGRRPRVVLG